MPHPTDPRALIAIDLGAESCRVSLLRWIDSKPTLTLVHRFPNSPRETPQGLRWDLAHIKKGLHQGLTEAAALAPEGIRSIAVDGWAVDYVRLNESSVATADPYCYRDERTLASEAALHKIISADRMREITGIGILRINTLYQQSADTPDNQQRPWLNLPEYILHTLGARPVAEYTNATHTQMIDLATRTWSSEILTAASLPITTFPELVPPGTQLGRLTGPLAALPAYKDTILIAPATHDTASAIAGIPAHGDDWAYISSGTWSLVGTLLETPSNHPEAAADNFTNLGAAGGLTCFHKNVNGMWLIRQSIDFWCENGQTWTVQDLVAAAEKLPAPTDLLDVDDPDLLLPGHMPQRINKQLTTRSLPKIDENDAPAIANLIFHSLAARYAQVLIHIALHSGKTFRRLFLVGGGSQNLFLNRLTEAATGLQVHRGSQESSTLGNFAIQLASLETPEGTPITPAQISHWAQVLEHAPHTAPKN
ncbi:rhamnulokinase [Granulicella tundricola]|uniref:Carbohydrate kinase, FGGY-like protein n=1 Tax=Granulicella tundricola (strain ATCC BAA-1859 / DSM 23138 / MP5ACTX9) TaxID=1198114 RepID=E8WZ94_GRATM|nr:FGGY-family carbohydrate kinase [Granulicella tundricola]ADW67696.1 Carbohydrate kinase, FGGY-like protein [Granulicella tundricola MP5ACTX9]